MLLLLLWPLHLLFLVVGGYCRSISVYVLKTLGTAVLLLLVSIDCVHREVLLLPLTDHLVGAVGDTAGELPLTCVHIICAVTMVLLPT